MTSENAMKGYRTKKIALPGGRTIEIVYFADAGSENDSAAEASHALAQRPAGDAAQAPGVDAATGGLHVCPECDGELVYPVAWEERSEERWRIERRCPNCEWRDVGEFDQMDVEDFDDVLNEGTEGLLLALRNFSRANMAADIERIITALNADEILPMDF